jgi:hypothetical protein
VMKPRKIQDLLNAKSSTNGLLKCTKTLRLAGLFRSGTVKNIKSLPRKK